MTKKKRWVFFTAKSVILATGGGGALFPSTTNVPGALGSGYALAFESGLTLSDMEFVQFVTVFRPQPGLSSRLPPVELFLLKGATLRGSDGRDLMAGNEVFTRDAVTRLAAEEILRNPDETVPVYLDLSTLPPEELEALPLSGKTKLPVGPAAHFFMGGIRVDHELKTGMEGLYAAGEVMGGVHGANRLGGNALAEAFVFGASTGHLAAAYAARNQAGRSFLYSEARKVINELESLPLPEDRPKRGPSKCIDPKKELKKILEEFAGPVRSGEDTQEGLSRLQGMREGFLRDGNSLDRWSRISFEQQMAVAEMILRSAIRREESRGAHFRLDFPFRDDREWKTSILVRKGSQEEMLVTKVMGEKTPVALLTRKFSKIINR